MSLRAYVAILWQRKWVVIVTATMAVAVAQIGTLVTPPQYRTSATLRISAGRGVGDPVRFDDLEYADRLMNTYAKIVTSGPVLGRVARQLGMPSPPRAEVEIVPHTELMKVSVEDRDPERAAAAANALAGALVDQARALNAGGGETAQQLLRERLALMETELKEARAAYERLATQSPEAEAQLLAAGRTLELKEELYAGLLDRYESARVSEAVRANAVSIVEPAVATWTPSTPRRELLVSLGFLLGLIGGGGLVFLVENLDTRLHSAERIASVTGLPILARIPAARQPGQSLFNSDSSQEEAFRHLRTQLFSRHPKARSKTLLVTSTEPGEGKSTVVANLARATGHSGRRVIVVDADLRRPHVHRIFGLPNDAGLSDVLQADVNPDDVIQDGRTPGVKVLTSGPLPPEPAELLESAPWGGLIRRLAQRFDAVIVDSPSLLAVTDAAVIAPTVGRVVLVVGRAQARREPVQEALRQLSHLNVQPVGVVVNRAEQDGHYSHYRQERGRVP